MVGQVAMFNTLKGYGFITTDNHKDVFFHRSQLLRSDRQEVLIKKGTKVQFDIEISDRGEHATNIVLLD